MLFFRIITFMANTHGQSPQHMLESGSRAIEYRGKQRVFTVRKVFYDDDMSPIYSVPRFKEKLFTDLDELKDVHRDQKAIFDSPILDKDNWLKVWNFDNELIYLNHESDN